MSLNITSPSLLLLFAAALACSMLSGCHRNTETPSTPSPVDAGLDADVDADVDASVDAAPADAAVVVDVGTTDTPIATPRCLSDAMADLEPHARWLARFDGSPAADKRPPPKLGALASLPKLPQSQLVWMRGGQIFVMQLPGGAERALTTGKHDTSPAFSPRGTHVAFLRRENGAEHAYLVRADGTDPQAQKISEISVQSPLTWSEDARFLAFRAENEITIHDFQTNTERHLPLPDRLSRMEDVDPVFEASGNRLAFAYDRHVYVADALTGVVERHDWEGRDEIMSVVLVRGALRIAMNAEPTPPSQTLVRRLPLDHKGNLEGELFPTPSVGASVMLFAAPNGARIALTNTTLEQSITKGPNGESLMEFGNWQRRNVAFYDVKPMGEDIIVARTFPQPRFSTSAPTWAKDSRHLGFVLELWQNVGDTDPMARGIVAVDTEHPETTAFVACGEMPSWGPASPSSNQETKRNKDLR